MSRRPRLRSWYWVMLALWAAAYAAVALMPGEFNLRTPIFLAFTSFAVNPLIGLPALVALLLPVLALPFGLRPELSPEK
jgi:hypothetical protein